MERNTISSGSDIDKHLQDVKTEGCHLWGKLYALIITDTEGRREAFVAPFVQNRSREMKEMTDKLYLKEIHNIVQKPKWLTYLCTMKCLSG